MDKEFASENIANQNYRGEGEGRSVGQKCSYMLAGLKFIKFSIRQCVD